MGLSASEGSLWYISLHSALSKGSKIKVAARNPWTGEQKGINALSSDNEIISQDLVLHVGKALLIWIDKGFKVLRINALGTKRITNINISSRNEQIQSVSVHEPKITGPQVPFLVHYRSIKSHWAEVYHVDISSGTAKKAYELPLLDGHGAFSTSTQGDNVYFTRNTDLDVTIFSSTVKDVLGHWPINSKSQSNLGDTHGISHAVSEVVARGSSNFAVRSASVLFSGDWELVRNGDSAWVRPEGLAGVVAAAFGEFISDDGLAEDLAAESHSSLFKAYIHRVRRHIRDLESVPAWVESLLRWVRVSGIGEQSSSANQEQKRNGFGFQRLVVLATERGRLIALDVGNQGRIAWNVGLIDKSFDQKWKICSIEVENGLALVQGCQGEIWRVRILDGTVVEHQSPSVGENMKASVSILDASGEKLSVAVHGDGSLGQYPRSKIPEGTLIITKGDQGTVQCWKLNKNADPTILWRFNPSSEETISNVLARPTHDPVASIGKALGDRNVLYKYLNPNVLLITTVNSKSAVVKVYLLDSSSGHTLHVALHSDVDTSRPIAAAISENWMAYSIFSDTVDNVQDEPAGSDTSPRGFQLIVSELFESQYPNDRGPLGSLSNFSAMYPSESENREINSTPFVISQAYSIPGPISHMSVTSTLQGITPRSLLCFLPSSDAIIAIPRAVLDPRRPVGRDSLPPEVEEGLFRHNAVLEFEPKWIVSHKRDIMSLSSIMTTPSRLESTSLLFSFGDIDIFGTRVAPIGGFDMLGKGFSKLQLVGTVIALAIATGVIAPMVSSFPSITIVTNSGPNMIIRSAKSRLTADGKPSW